MLINQKQNLIKQQYLSSKTNHVICIDITKLGTFYGYCFAAIDLAARNIVGHCYKEQPLNVQDILDCLSAIIQQRSFLPKIQIIHSDRESFFKNEQYYNFLDEHQIQISRGSTKGHDNQVIERTFRTLKDILRTQLQVDWKYKSKTDPLKQKGFSIKQIDEALQKAIEIYNNKPHKALYLMSPNQMEEALFQQNYEEKNNNHNHHEKVPLLARNSNSIEANEIINYKHQVIQNYAGNWQRFFLDFRNENAQKLNQIATQNHNLYQQNLQLQEALSFVKTEMEVMQKARIRAEQRREKRQKATKQVMRDSISSDDFQFILNSVKFTGFVPARKRAAFILLYSTGLRVSNLLALTINHIKELLDKGKTFIPLNKGGDPRHALALSPNGKKMLNQHLPDFSKLMADKEGTHPLFTTQMQLEKPINRSSFDNELNHVLKKASLALHKHIRTHSFRATLITDLLETTPIQVVKDIIGHRSIKTTVQYNRNKITEPQLHKVLSHIDKTRKNESHEVSDPSTDHHI